MFKTIFAGLIALLALVGSYFAARSISGKDLGWEHTKDTLSDYGKALVHTENAADCPQFVPKTVEGFNPRQARG